MVIQALPAPTANAAIESGAPVEASAPASAGAVGASDPVPPAISATVPPIALETQDGAGSGGELVSTDRDTAGAGTPLAAPEVDTDTAATTRPGLSTTSIAWTLALSLALLAWWVASRRSHRLSRETQQLSRQQRQLRSAHEQLRQQSAHLRNLSIHDPLTGTLNRQAFAGELRELLDHLSRFSRPLNLIVFDLDHFKSINDQRGHLAGDAALKLVVGIVREHLVSADLFGRFGGDEFLIACADQSEASCTQLADTIRAAVEHKAPLHHPPLPGLTLSLGLAQANPSAGYLPDDLFARADAALYEAKRQGRNRVCAADTTLPGSPPPSHRHL